MIDCIAIPTTSREIGDLSILFACWHLLHHGDKLTQRLLITFSGAHNPALQNKVETLIKIFSIETLFYHIDINFLDIPECDDIYIKDCANWSGPIPRFGYKSGPNLQFFKTLRSAYDSKFTFLNETDVLPLGQSWLSNLSSSLREEHDWVLGASYKGNTIISPDILSHINGAAVYSTGNEMFRDFCDHYWEPGVEEMCKELPDTAYDIWISRMQHKFSVDPHAWINAGDNFRKAFADALSRFTMTNTIANLTLANDFMPLPDLRNQGHMLAHGKHFKYPALAYALEYAAEIKALQLSRVQQMAIISRCNNSIQAILALKSYMPSSIIPIAQKIESRKQSKYTPIDSSNPGSIIADHHSYQKNADLLPAIDCVKSVKLSPELSDICIFTRSYIGDASLLPGMYSSIEKHFSKVAECVLVVEEQDYEEMAKIVPSWVKIATEPKFTTGSIQHKYSKLTADIHTACDWIFHIDSDTLVTSNISVDYLLRDGKPILEITPYEKLREYQNGEDFCNYMRSYVVDNHLPQELQKEGVKNMENWIRDHFDFWFEDWFPKWKYAFGLDVWQEGTGFAFGSPIDIEFSQKPIKLYPRQVYPVAREHIKIVHGMSLSDFIITRIGKQSYGTRRDQYFSDLNFIGACLFYYFHDSVHWIRTDLDGFDFRPTHFNQRISYDLLK